MIAYFHIIMLLASTFCMNNIDGSKHQVVINATTSRITPTQEQIDFVCNMQRFEAWIQAQGYTVLIGHPYTTHIKERYNNVDEEDWDRSLYYDRMDTDMQIIAPDGHILTTREELRPFGEYWSSLSTNNCWDEN